MNIEDVLKFYADPDNYIFTDDGKGTVLPSEEDQSRITRDFGKKAQDFLDKYLKSIKHQ